jgi:hypothetical protein
VSALKVSDHALVRFLARSGVEVEAMRAELEQALARAHAAAELLGGGDHLIVAGGLVYVVRNNVVVTVVRQGSRAAKARLLKPRPSAA